MILRLPLRFWLLVAASTIAVLFAFSSPRASSCVSVRDYDKRQACLAEERRSPETCTSIRDADERALCRQRAGERDPFGRPRR